MTILASFVQDTEWRGDKRDLKDSGAGGKEKSMKWISKIIGFVQHNTNWFIHCDQTSAIDNISV